MLEKLILCLACAVYVLVWGRLLWFMSEKSRMVERFVRFLMGRSRGTHDELKAVLLSWIYCLFTFGGLAALAAYTKPDLRAVLAFRIDYIPLVVLGFLAQVMTISLVLPLLLPALGPLVRRRPEEEVSAVPWISGIMKIKNPVIVALVPGFSGFFEELFFRGALLVAMIDVVGMSPLPAVATVTAAFAAQQLLQLRSVGQMAIIGASCLIISAIGSCLVLYTGSAIPSALAHAAFAVFYVRFSSRPNRGYEEFV